MFEQSFKNIDILYKDAGCTSELDYNAALTGDDLRELVNSKLFPYFAGFELRAAIALIRRQVLVLNGTAEYVGGQQRLL